MHRHSFYGHNVAGCFRYEIFFSCLTLCWYPCVFPGGVTVAGCEKWLTLLRERGSHRVGTQWRSKNAFTAPPLPVISGEHSVLKFKFAKKLPLQRDEAEPNGLAALSAEHKVAQNIKAPKREETAQRGCNRDFCCTKGPPQFREVSWLCSLANSVVEAESVRRLLTFNVCECFASEVFACLHCQSEVIRVVRCRTSLIRTSAHWITLRLALTWGYVRHVSVCLLLPDACKTSRITDFCLERHKEVHAPALFPRLHKYSRPSLNRKSLWKINLFIYTTLHFLLNSPAEGSRYRSKCFTSRWAPRSRNLLTLAVRTVSEVSQLGVRADTRAI